MRKIGLFFIMSLLGLVITACGASSDQDSKSADSTTNSEESSTITVHHELGETEVQKNPEKVVVFDFGSLDSLDKLGVEVIGVPQGNTPAYLDKYDGEA